MSKRSLKKAGLKTRKQDIRFPTDTMYAVVFFPKIEGLKTKVTAFNMYETCAPTPKQAKQLFLGRTSDRWRRLNRAGWEVRKIKVTDLGSAETVAQTAAKEGRT